MSYLSEKPRFYQSVGKSERIELYNIHTSDGKKSDKAINPKESQGHFRMLLYLLRIISNYSDKDKFKNKKQLIKKRRKGYSHF